MGSPGATFKAGDTLMPIWEVRNTSPSGLWTEGRVKPVGDNVLAAPENGFEVPSVAAGQSGLVSLNLSVPVPLANQNEDVTPVEAESALREANMDLNTAVIALLRKKAASSV